MQGKVSQIGQRRPANLRAATEVVEAARTRRLLVDADLEPERVIRGEIEVIQRNARLSLAVDEAPARRDGPRGERAVLRALELPPARREFAAPVAKTALSAGRYCPRDRRSGNSGGQYRPAERAVLATG